PCRRARGARQGRRVDPRLPGPDRAEAPVPRAGQLTAANAAEGAPRQGGAARRRSVARLGAVQALYQLELNPGLGAEAAIREFIRDRLGREIDGDVYGEADEALFGEIVRGVAADRER